MSGAVTFKTDIYLYYCNENMINIFKYIACYINKKWEKKGKTYWEEIFYYLIFSFFLYTSCILCAYGYGCVC